MVLVIVAAITGYVIGKHTINDKKVKPENKVQLDPVDSDQSTEPCKMVLIVRKDLPMTKGKIAAQCAHAALACYERAVAKTPLNVKRWKREGQAKIALQVDSLDELRRLEVRAGRLGIVAEHIVDAGRTQIDPGSVTVLGLGPAPVSKINEVSGHLKLL